MAGLGGILIFVPQIMILFGLITLLEDSGYMARIAFLMDRLMRTMNLHGRAFVPMLSGFACAVPAIMATRTMERRRDQILTMMVIPLTTCSARLPVYALLIGAFIPRRQVWGGLELQGLVLLALYVAGIAGALAVAWVLKRLTARRQVRTLMMELPMYHLPALRNVAIGLWQRVEIFMKRVGGLKQQLASNLRELPSEEGTPRIIQPFFRNTFKTVSQTLPEYYVYYLYRY